MNLNEFHEPFSINITFALLKSFIDIFFVEPVSVVSIAGPCRDGKSYILSEAFRQPDVFPVGHKMDPETMEIWIWILPHTMKASKLLTQLMF